MKTTAKFLAYTGLAAALALGFAVTARGAESSLPNVPCTTSRLASHG